MHELPLVIFTVLGQAAAGAYLILLIGKKFNKMEERKFANGTLWITLVFAVGMLAGMFHLGQPQRALNLLYGLGRSPMSNEIVLAGAFACFSVLSGLLSRYNKGSQGQRVKLHWLTAACALGFLVSIPFVYQLSTVATWNTLYTSFQMLLTAGICGGALAALLGAYRQGIIVSIAATLAAFVMRSDYLSAITGINAELASQQGAFWLLQALALCLGIGTAIFAITKNKVSHPVLLSVCGFMLVGELLGRISFYNLWSIAM